MPGIELVPIRDDMMEAIRGDDGKEVAVINNFGL
jgi:hypothetical protein